jgi:hypothetical protein
MMVLHFSFSLMAQEPARESTRPMDGRDWGGLLRFQYRGQMSWADGHLWSIDLMNVNGFTGIATWTL